MGLFLANCGELRPAQTQIEIYAATDELGHIPGAVAGAIDQFVGPRKTSFFGAVAGGVKEAFVPAAQGGAPSVAGAVAAPKTKVRRGDNRQVGVRFAHIIPGPAGINLRSSVGVGHEVSKYYLPNGITIRNGRTRIPQAIKLQFESQSVELEQTLARAFKVAGPVRAELGLGGGVVFARTKTKIDSPILDVDHTGSQRLPYAIVRLDVIGPADVRLRGEVRQYKGVGPSASLGLARRF
jgi:hypothetical protein